MAAEGPGCDVAASATAEGSRRDGAAGAAHTPPPDPSSVSPAPKRDPTAEARRIIEAAAAEDPFGVLGLPPPHLDALGRAAWAVTAAELASSYRKLSLAVHPDRHAGSALAREAFEALDAARQELADPGRLELQLRKRTAMARLEAERARGAGGPESRAALATAEREEAARLREEEAEALRRSVVGSLRRAEGAASAKRRRDAARAEGVGGGGNVWTEGGGDLRVPREARGAGRDEAEGAEGLGGVTEWSGADGEGVASRTDPAAPPTSRPVDASDEDAAARRRAAASRRKRGRGGGRRGETAA